jgi:hypothetical protein
MIGQTSRVDYDPGLGKPDERRWELKTLLSF